MAGTPYALPTKRSEESQRTKGAWIAVAFAVGIFLVGTVLFLLLRRSAKLFKSCMSLRWVKGRRTYRSYQEIEGDEWEVSPIRRADKGERRNASHYVPGSLEPGRSDERLRRRNWTRYEETVTNGTLGEEEETEDMQDQVGLNREVGGEQQEVDEEGREHHEALEDPVFGQNEQVENAQLSERSTSRVSDCTTTTIMSNPPPSYKSHDPDNPFDDSTVPEYCSIHSVDPERTSQDAARS